MKKAAPKFGFVLGLMSALFHASMCLLERIKHKIPLNKRTIKFFMLFISGAISSLPMSLMAEAQEQNLMKLFFFPLAFRCLFDKLFESGVIPTFKHGDILSYVLVNSLVSYVWTYEKYSNSPSLSKSIDQYTRVKQLEKRFFHNMTTV